ncbi:hypothetical protein EW146_g3362 [Bondarzewia mesenterica]|uniref:ubiquitinyl hydrolase 1 n=1 Tax=Bondarzewia mesenterica TaxID=1095465 RepID=A0A4S4LZZ8_9AGAM|nr:hypothetical protein EW146_g3362 [Bondarzewia mesenterica]
MQLANGSPRPLDDMSVAELRERAIQQAQKASKGASAMSLIQAARGQIVLAQSCENAGDLKGALIAFTKAASLAKTVMDTSEFTAENTPGKRGVIWREFSDFQQHEGNDLTKRVLALESRLLQVEKTATQLNGLESPPAEAPVQKLGVSIADRMRSLQDAGLSVGTSKRLSREIPNGFPSSSPQSPTSDDRPRANPIPGLGILTPAVNQTVSTSASGTIHTLAPSPHALVSPSTLSPPSPSSSASSSPRASLFSLSEFAQTFPSIDELEESDGRQLAAVNTGASSSSRRSRRDNTGDRSPSVAKPFPILPFNPGPRPSSTPISPMIDSFASRPASPSRSPLSPTIPHKPSGLLAKSSRSPLIPASSIVDKPSVDLPVKNVALPRELRDYMYKNQLKVLFLDLRTREEFDREHILADAVVCIEPSVLTRASVSGQDIEDSLTVAPRVEWGLFCNREKFDLVAIYDNSSESFGRLDAPLSSLVRAIYETAFKKVLKKVPVLLAGGLKAWKKEFGDQYVVKAEVDQTAPILPTPLANGYAATTPSVSHSVAPSPSTMPRSPTSGRSRAATGAGLDVLANSKAAIVRHSLDQTPGSSRSTTDTVDVIGTSEPIRRLVRKPTMSRPPSTSSISSFSRTISENISSPSIPQSMVNGSGIQYPQFARTMSPTLSGSSFNHSAGLVSPPQASISSSPLSRRRSDYVDQSQEALSGIARPSIDYPELSSQHILRPPPVAASPGLERKDSRPRLPQHNHSFSLPQAGPTPPTLPSDYPVTYWSDVQIGTSGLKNLGNTCYMNATIQCLSATVPFARFFTDGRWKSAVNMVNPLGTKGNLAHAFASILHDLWHGEMSYISPFPFRRSICMHASQFSGSDQHDSQEFLIFLLDGLHEDLNRVLHKPLSLVSHEREAELEKLPQQIASEQEWQLYCRRNDSLIVDYFQGQFRNRLECLTCHKTSTTYNSFMYLSLPVPTNKIHKVSLQQCLDAFVKEEVMEKSDAWNCPHCKTLRKATKQLSLSRLPPVLLIHLKRFSFKGPFTDKIEKTVDFPLKGLDLTNYMPSPLPPGVDRGRMGSQFLSADDPRLQIPPYRYDLYAVTNHVGTLSSGHYTAFIASRGGWLYCDDSRITQADAKEIVGKPAYVLYYKRVKA